MSKPGKYDQVLADMPRMPEGMMHDEGGPDYQERVQRAKEEFQERTPAALAEAWINLREEEDRIEELAKAVRLKLRAVEQLMEASFEEKNVKSVAFNGRPGVRYQPEPHAVVSNRDEYRAWCLSNDMVSQMSMPWQTTNSDAKERILNGKPLPPGVDVYRRRKFVKS